MGKKLWTGLLTGLVVLVMAAPSALASTDYTGFYSERELSRAGWSTCRPITWTVDVSGLKSGAARDEIAALKQAWRQWSRASGVRIEFAGRERLAFDPMTYGLRPVNGSPRTDNHVYIALKTRAQVPIMARNAVGLAMPTQVMLPTQEITAGMAIFRRGYVVEQRRVSPDRVRHLYLHELGHVLGLGHAADAVNIMHPTLNERTALGAGDRAGIFAHTQPCPVA